MGLYSGGGAPPTASCIGGGKKNMIGGLSVYAHKCALACSPPLSASRSVMGKGHGAQIETPVVMEGVGQR